MDRRTFITTLSGGAAALLLPSCALKRSPLRFGIVTDCHYARKDMNINRFYRDSILKLRKAVETFNRSDLDFVIELGDFKDMGNGGEAEALAFLDEIEGELRKFNGPCYHVLGNHDMDCISKEQFLAHTCNHGAAKGKAYYSFRKKGIRFIVLDGNFNEDRSPYSKGNFEWWKAYIPQEQIDWLDGTLSESREPVIVICHQMLDKFSDISPKLCIGNAEEVVDVLERHGNVVALLQGHHHSGHYSYRNGIHYWTMKAMIESEYPLHNSYAIVEIDGRGSITIEGFADCESRSLGR